jgi:hypothetical protein
MPSSHRLLADIPLTPIIYTLATLYYTGGTIELIDFEIAVSTPERPGPRPIFLIVREVQFTGGDECHTFGNPTDANCEVSVTHALARHPPEELRWHFQRSQVQTDCTVAPPWQGFTTGGPRSTGCSGFAGEEVSDVALGLADSSLMCVVPCD